MSGAAGARPDRRQMEHADAARALREGVSLRRVAQAHSRYFAAHADADASRPATQRPDFAHRVSDAAAERRVSSDAARTVADGAGGFAGALGRKALWKNSLRARRLRPQGRSRLSKLIRQV